MVKQYIILRRHAPTVTGEPVSPAKLAVMTAHASMCFLSRQVIANCNDDGEVSMKLDDEAREWMAGPFTKILLQAKNLRAMEKAVQLAKKNGLKEDRDFFCIRDDCHTELRPDEGRNDCFIAIGFRPMEEERTYPVTKKFELYRWDHGDRGF